MTGNEGLLSLVGIFNELNVPYMMVGSYSSNFYGIPRSTKDADLVCEIDFTHIEHWCESHGTMDLLEKARAVV